MGLDIALGVVTFLGGLRGWFRGFGLQASRLGALVASVYAADPIRDLARPLAHKYMPSLAVDLLDRLLWWTSAAVAFVVMAGLASWILKASRRRPIGGESEPNRADQGAGFLYGASQAAVALCFLTPLITKYGPGYAPQVGPWAVEQLQTSRALAWSDRYRPAERIWGSVPVQAFLARVRSRGIGPAAPASAPAPADEAESPSKAAVADRPGARPRSMALPGEVGADPDFDARVARIKDDLERMERDAARPPARPDR